MCSVPVYVGLDLETTGLNPCAVNGEPADLVVEVGMVAFDSDLQPLATFQRLVNAIPALERRASGGVNDFVERMHTTNGLWAELEEVGERDTSLGAVEAEAMQWLQDLGWEAENKPPMLGSSITFDREFLRYSMPGLLGMFHYRSVDATTLALLVEKTLGKDVSTVMAGEHKGGAHRVIDDILHSAAMIRACMKEMKK